MKANYQVVFVIVNKCREYLGDLEESLCHCFWGHFTVLKHSSELALFSEYFFTY